MKARVGPRGSGFGLRALTFLMTLALAALASTIDPPAAAQQVAFDEAVRNLRNPDLRTRLAAVKMLRESNYPEAAVPVATAITDVEDAVQLEAISAELTFFLSNVRSNKRIGVVIEKRGQSSPQHAFAQGPDVVAPRVVPPEVPLALANALKDRSSKVRLAAVYGFGVLTPAAPEFRPSTLQEAATTVALMIRQDESAIREGAALVAGRVWKDCGRFTTPPAGCAIAGDALIDGMNDRDQGIQLAAMDSLGQLRYGAAVQSLTDRFTYHRSGRAAEIALNAVARIGNPVSVPLFRTLLKDRREGARVLGIEGLARAGDKASLPDIEAAAARKSSPAVALALAYAEHKLAATARLEPLVRALARERTRALAKEYLVDVGSADAAALAGFLQDPDPTVRAEVARVLARVGDTAVLPRVEPLLRDPDPRVAEIAGVVVARLRAASR